MIGTCASTQPRSTSTRRTTSRSRALPPPRRRWPRQYSALIQTASTESTDGAPLKKHPLYRLYAPANPVLKEEYTILTLEEHRKIASKEEEELVRERVREWIEVGYHIHVAQAFKVDQSHGKLLLFL